MLVTVCCLRVFCARYSQTLAQVLEFRFPLRVEAFAIRKGSGGGGKHKGGDGIERRLKFLAPMTVGILANRRDVSTTHKKPPSR